MIGCGAQQIPIPRDGYFVSTNIEVVNPSQYIVTKGAITSDSLENMTKSAFLILDGYTYKEIEGKYINILKKDVKVNLIGVSAPMAAVIYSDEYMIPVNIGPFMQFETEDGDTFWVYPTEHVRKGRGT